jgi:hypothetical protein
MLSAGSDKDTEFGRLGDVVMTSEERRAYIDETAKRYAENVRYCMEVLRYHPISRDHLSEEYWRKELEKKL